MNCPACKAPGSRVRDTRDNKDNVRRMRTCFCGAEWWTREKTEKSTFLIRRTRIVDMDDPISGQLVADGESINPPSLGSPISGSDLRSGSGDQIPYQQSVSNSNMMSAKAPNVFDKVAGMFVELWTQKYGAKYFVTPGDRNQLGRLLQGLPRECLKELRPAFTAYLADTDRWVAQTRRHCLTEFCLQGFNKYRAKSPPPPQAAKPLPYESRRDPKALGWPKGKDVSETQPVRQNGQPEGIAEILHTWMKDK